MSLLARTRVFRTLALRWLALVALAVWFGGFTFYSAVVVPILSDVMGKVEAGSMVTREATVTLNGIGVATLSVWWALALAEWSQGGPRLRLTRLALLAGNSGLLGWLYVLHGVLGRQLDEAEMSGFYSRHEFYLILSTIQWGINLALIAVSLGIWHAGRAETATHVEV